MKNIRTKIKGTNITANEVLKLSAICEYKFIPINDGLAAESYNT